MKQLCILLVLLCEICQVPAVNQTLGITQDSGIITAQVGHTVTLKCFCPGNAITSLSWYQQSLGGKPFIISTRMQYKTEASIHSEYKERFNVVADSVKGINHLKISNLRLSDSAMYYCGNLEFNAIEFGQGAFLHVKTSLSNIQAVVRQPALEPLWSGDSVNLSCTVYTDRCAGEQSLYWFRHGVAQPAIMYHSSGECKNLSSKESHMKICSLNLVIKYVSSSDAGMYYCALGSCGEIVFGNGTRVEIAGRSTKSSLLVYCLCVALAVSIIVLLVLAFIMHRLKQNSCSVCKGTVSHLTCSAASDALQSQDADILHYAALSLNKTSGRHRQEDNEESVCVYSRVKSRKE